MNYLGHLYLSGDDPLVITGNFMADAVKGRDLSRFAPRIQEGIRLHRRIDSFTDAQRPVHAGRAALRAHAGRYAPVAIDLFFDHLLARDWGRWHPEPLSDFTGRMYTLLQEHAADMPERTQRMLPYLVGGDWLRTYASLDGIGRALHGMARRFQGAGPLAGAESVLAAHIAEFEQEFDAFLPALKDHLRAGA